MPKIRNIDAKGLVQVPGSGVTFEQNGITRTLLAEQATVNTVNGTTFTNTGITPVVGDRCLGYKIEVLSSAGAPAGNITKLGDAGDDDRYSGAFTLTAATAGGSRIKPAVAAARDADLPATEIKITHTDPGGAGKTSKVRVTVFLERYS